MNNDSKIKSTRWGYAAAVISMTLVATLLATSLISGPAAAGGGGRRSGLTQECSESVCSVSMAGAMFTPEIIQARPGATVVWSSSDKMPHTVTSVSSRTGVDPLFDSGVLTPTSGNKLWDLTFEKTGTYDYFCQLHPMMAGQVVIAGEPLGDITRLTQMLVMAAGVFGTFGAITGIHLKLKKQRPR